METPEPNAGATRIVPVCPYTGERLDTSSPLPAAHPSPRPFSPSGALMSGRCSPPWVCTDRDKRDGDGAGACCGRTPARSQLQFNPARLPPVPGPLVYLRPLLPGATLGRYPQRGAEARFNAAKNKWINTKIVGDKIYRIFFFFFFFEAAKITSKNSQPPFPNHRAEAGERERGDEGKGTGGGDLWARLWGGPGAGEGTEAP